MDIKAAIFKQPKQPFEFEHVQLDELKEGEVLVKLVATGVCHTDISVWEANFPFGYPGILGHEGAGIVEAVGPGVTKVKAGNHVLLHIAACGKCEYCISGTPAYCKDMLPLNFSGRRPDGSCPYHLHGEDLNGLFFYQSSFATYSIASERNVVAIPDDLPLPVMAPLGCGFITGAGTVMNTLKAEPGTSIAIFGAGSVGLAAVMAAKIAGCTTIVTIDINDERLALAKELGATHTINGRNSNSSEEIQTRIIPGGVNFSIDTTGDSSVIQHAVTALRILGTCALVAVRTVGAKQEFDYLNLALGRTVKGVIAGDSIPEIFIPRLISFYRQGLFPIDRLISFYNFEDINNAIQDAGSGKTIKAVLLMQ
ncbi:NAD(P)-dependent alcohol dehydrogenase [Chitinophaga sp. Mgbs1]|uniref:NAD(P)-dependent alcohol dehydrogenase n=1 Tax=Chitinophaga solisilvae TaxID=1233460 RepID=A0A3S1BN59_9BACT|nr:NAD(P)-dependent alcohol dehydrogenase [Chitinophaga solisilvae]